MSIRIANVEKDSTIIQEKPDSNFGNDELLEIGDGREALLSMKGDVDFTFETFVVTDASSSVPVSVPESSGTGFLYVPKFGKSEPAEFVPEPRVDRKVWLRLWHAFSGFLDRDFRVEFYPSPDFDEGTGIDGHPEQDGVTWESAADERTNPDASTSSVDPFVDVSNILQRQEAIRVGLGAKPVSDRSSEIYFYSKDTRTVFEPYFVIGEDYPTRTTTIEPSSGPFAAFQVQDQKKYRIGTRQRLFFRLGPKFRQRQFLGDRKPEVGTQIAEDPVLFNIVDEFGHKLLPDFDDEFAAADLKDDVYSFGLDLVGFFHPKRRYTVSLKIGDQTLESAFTFTT